MLVNLTNVFSSVEKVVKKDISLEMDDFSYNGEKHSIIFKEPVAMTFTNLAVGKVLVEGSSKLSIDMKCDRCLNAVPYEMDLQFSYEVFSPDKISEAEEDDEQNFMEGYELNVVNLVNNEILMSWPMKVLCKPQCKGICTVCGKDLNTGECGCDTFVPDPRWAALKDIFNANKEV